MTIKKLGCATCCIGILVLGIITTQAQIMESRAPQDGLERSKERPQCRGSYQPDEKELEETIKKALKFISSKQNEDGTWASIESEKYALYTNSLCALALMASGSTAKDGTYQKEISKALDSIIKNEQHISAAEKSSAQHKSHDETVAVAVILAHAYQAEKSEKVKEILVKIRDSYMAKQKDDGGWGYSTLFSRPGMSYLTSNILLALLMINHVGIEVDSKVFENAAKFYQQPELLRGEGSFFYFIPKDKRDNVVPDLDKRNPQGAIGRTAVALWCMELLGLSKTKTYEKASTFTEKRIKDADLSQHGPSYQLFWSALACYCLENKKLWEIYQQSFPKIILKAQKEDGSIFLEPRKEAYVPIDGASHFKFTTSVYTTAHYAVVLQTHKGNLLFGKLKPLNSK